MSRAMSILLVVLLTSCSVISVHAQCSLYTTCGSCTSRSGCGWCGSKGRCVPGSSSGPSYGSGVDACSCASWTYDSCVNYSQCPAAARNWVTAVWATILVVCVVFALCWYIRHRRRQIYYQQQAALNPNQPTIITSQATYAAAPGPMGAPVMATVASPVMATMAQPVMAQPVYAAGQPAPQYYPQPQPQPQPQSPQPSGEGQPQPQPQAQAQAQPMYTAPYGQPQQGYAPVYSPAPGYAYTPAAGEGGQLLMQQPLMGNPNALPSSPSPPLGVAPGQPYVPVYGAPPAQVPTPQQTS